MQERERGAFRFRFRFLTWVDPLGSALVEPRDRIGHAVAEVHPCVAEADARVRCREAHLLLCCGVVGVHCRQEVVREHLSYQTHRRGTRVHSQILPLPTHTPKLRLKCAPGLRISVT
jgi:hypothetical protein